jgi:hypothetical protein
MARHLSEDEIADALFERGSPARREHLQACSDCAGRLAVASEGLTVAREAEVPEPSPLYWEAFRRQVDRRIGAEGAPPRRAWLVPLATAAAIAVLAVPFLRPPATDPPKPASLPSWSSLPPAEEDDGLAVLRAVSLADSDLLSVRESRGMDDVLTDLSDDETVALTEALRRELKADRL